ncbi:MAG: nucleotide exchange factor GrpE [Candidatus Moranbacteria bacterium]|nr:nucleotide exchange factor GrpE [Candidatus Moranbacteria bacterium]
MSKQHKKDEEVEVKKEVEEEIVADSDLPTEKVDLSANEVEDEVSILKKQVQENLDNWKRAQADFENYKKMQAESQKDLLKYATQNIILQIIPVLDNFQMSTAHVPEDQKEGGWVTGIMYIQKQLETVLAENGVEEIAPKVGDSFDPVFHEAIADKQCGCDHCDCEKEKEKFKNKIKKVMMKGYKIGDKVIRAARVVAE